MPVVLYAFTFNTETQEAAMTGNVPVAEALNILQQIMIAEGIKKQREDSKELSCNQCKYIAENGLCARAHIEGQPEDMSFAPKCPDFKEKD